MVSTEGRFLQWLRDAHAIEEQAQQMLSGTARRIKNYPELKAQLERHLDESRRHADMVRRCIERRGSNISTLKDTAAKLVAWSGSERIVRWRRDRQGSPRDLHVRAHGNRVVQDPDRNGGGARRYRNQACMRADFAGRREHGALARREPPLGDETVFGSRPIGKLSDGWGSDWGIRPGRLNVRFARSDLAGRGMSTLPGRPCSDWETERNWISCVAMRRDKWHVK
jgi:hypothetical protein